MTATATHLSLVVPLTIACCVIVGAIPSLAFRSRLHIPGYVGLAFLTFALGLLCGRISGARGITGTHTGVALSILFFLSLAVALGSVLALFVYRDPPEV